MTPLPAEFKDLLKSFNDVGLMYLLVGGWAVGHHGYLRYTGDIDFWIAVSSENADRLIHALMKFMGTAPPKSSIIKQRKTLEFGKPPLKVHIMCDIAGVEFDACYERRTDSDWDGVPVPIIGRDDLLKNKMAAGRLKDRADVDYLQKLSKRAKRKRKE